MFDVVDLLRNESMVAPNVVLPVQNFRPRLQTMTAIDPLKKNKNKNNNSMQSSDLALHDVDIAPVLQESVK